MVVILVPSQRDRQHVLADDAPCNKNKKSHPSGVRCKNEAVRWHFKELCSLAELAASHA